MFHRFLLAAVVAGAVAGFALTGAQALRALPLIHQAEVYETAAHAALAAASAHEEAGWQPAEGPERFAFTLLANLLAGIGFALLLVAGYGFFGPVGWRSGVLWGLGGFAAFSLAPALGLPPELPGTESAALAARQLWWIATAGGTAAGFMLLAFAPRWWWKAIGVALVALPHLVGAPHPDHPAAAAPAELAERFVTASIFANLVFWLVLGPVSAALFARLVQPAIARG